MPTTFLIELLMGTGIISMLFAINKQLGGIKADLHNYGQVVHDHEKRIRTLEKH